MPQLPTIEVTDAQAQRILAAFGDATAYRAWLRERVIDRVLEHEQATMQARALEAQRTRLAALRAELEA